jgi:hypothetical protein
MGSYTFTLDKFHIRHTRAVHNDTDTVSFGVKVGNNTLPPQIKHMGDVNDGDHQVGLSFGPVEIDNPATPVVITYTIVNAGHNKEKVDNQLGSTSQALMAKADTDGGDATTMDGSAAENTDGGWAKELVDLGKALLDLLEGIDCDGPVASNRIALTASTIDQQIAESNAISITTDFPGVDSDVGCGDNSYYSVTYSINRSGPAASHAGNANVGAHTGVGVGHGIGIHKNVGTGS